MRLTVILGYGEWFSHLFLALFWLNCVKLHEISCIPKKCMRLILLFHQSDLFLSSQPEQSEIKQIAAEGILTCLQDAIDSLEQNQV